jgi:hypothetical protein
MAERFDPTPELFKFFSAHQAASTPHDCHTVLGFDLE